jgi:transcriptional regulator with XRE-family HTH domain
MPTGRLLKAGRALAGLELRELAKLSGLDASTISRMEGADDETVRGRAANVQKVLSALARKGVEITDDSVRQTRGRK